MTQPITVPRQIHELKTDPDVYDAVAAGLKTFEIRKDDRGFDVGDYLKLRRTQFTGEEMSGENPMPLVYTGEELTVRISHRLRGPVYGLVEGWVILSLENPTVMQRWTNSLPRMQQTVLITGIRGPDGIAKYGDVKNLLRWYRRCVLVSALDNCTLTDPYDTRGGSFTGPSIATPNGFPEGKQFGTLEWEPAMNKVAGEYLKVQDALPFHFQMHLMHASEILGYKHPDQRIRSWWNNFYVRLVDSMHLHREEQWEMDKRLGDCREAWLERADPATQA